jgi:hypothetical protein
MSEMCIYSFVLRLFPFLLAKKKIAPFIIIFAGIVCLCVVHTLANLY